MFRLFLASLLLFAPGALSAQCTEGRVALKGDWGQARFSVEVADDALERGIGLMNRPHMAASAGMLFVYETPQSVSFWMKNTLIPLDMLFFDETGVLRHIHENATPRDLTPIPGGDDIQFVLEINGGLSKQLGIMTGSQLQHPSLAEELASWPCSAS